MLGRYLIPSGGSPHKSLVKVSSTSPLYKSSKKLFGQAVKTYSESGSKNAVCTIYYNINHLKEMGIMVVFQNNEVEITKTNWKENNCVIVTDLETGFEILMDSKEIKEYFGVSL